MGGRREEFVSWVLSVSNVSKFVLCYPAVFPGPFGQQKREPGIGHYMEGVSSKSKGLRRTRGSMHAMGSGLGVRSCTSLGSWERQWCWEVGEGSSKGWQTDEVEGI